MSLDLDEAGPLTREDVETIEAIADHTRGSTWSRIDWRLARRVLRELRDLRAKLDAAEEERHAVYRAGQRSVREILERDREDRGALLRERYALLNRAEAAEREAERLRHGVEGGGD